MSKYISIFVLLYFSLIALVIDVKYNYKSLVGFENVNKKDKTIAFSLTCHECPDCVVDLIENIFTCFRHFNVYILISTDESILKDLTEKLDKYENVIIVTSRTGSIWANLQLFQQHIYNIKYLKDKHIEYDYFCFVASNEYFIKIVDPNIFTIKKNIEFPTETVQKRTDITDDELNTYYKNLKDKTNTEINVGQWKGAMEEDTYMHDAFKTEKMKIYKGYFEGTIIDKHWIEEMYDNYSKYNYLENSKNSNYPMEEIFINSYLKSKYNVTNLHSYCNFMNWSGKSLNGSFDDPFTLSVKPVSRNMDDETRVLLRNRVSSL